MSPIDPKVDSQALVLALNQGVYQLLKNSLGEMSTKYAYRSSFVSAKDWTRYSYQASRLNTSERIVTYLRYLDSSLLFYHS